MKYKMQVKVTAIADINVYANNKSDAIKIAKNSNIDLDIFNFIDFDSTSGEKVVELTDEDVFYINKDIEILSTSKGSTVSDKNFKSRIWKRKN